MSGRAMKEVKINSSTPKIQKFAVGGVGKICKEQSDKDGSIKSEK